MKTSSDQRPRRFNSEIFVDSEDRWIFQGNRIDQKEILAYFRQNLREDELGIYIDNRFGEWTENGYLELEGYPIHLIECKESEGTLFFLAESDRSYALKDLMFAIDINGCLFARTANHKKLKFRPDRNCLSDLSPFLEESKDGIEIRFFEEKILIPESYESPRVSLPAEFNSSFSRKN
ncbi:hypothetical protein QMM42_06515 [Leptospira santarosai]|uniref:DUF1285 domain-containing protein n=1 Tax=Leptospira santarosai str. CBC1416 TaxID=1193059 RepID=M6VUN3_9LEPT|nr:MULTISPECIES: hypothetical protein [Leptospira]EMO56744.1 hypothetical protein LEP1GSC161_0912 [Leptospira santarosai str. CBC1416]EKO78925.1 hypothetical protein LEP1GSC068_1870 [Leptospira sp. Fiocruz LV3954]EKS08587.1 hypothetical protein LEP1GSC071_3525 [Leptospira santarosai str. JET]EMF88711.1 hypothetical protein LEP1GSC005_1753 [Leptospira santarosai str. ST188]EMI65839.1 hypothetical protein LEP1GSC076_0029 [Leptospira sp. Fiocruz LV4135]